VIERGDEQPGRRDARHARHTHRHRFSGRRRHRQIEKVAYGLEKHRSVLLYEYTVSSLNRDSLAKLAELLASREEIASFHILPSDE
jgi:hypothetical protein